MNPLKLYCEALPQGIKQSGQTADEPEEISLSAGKLKMIFRDGSLRNISAGSNELIRMIYAAVRAQDWITVKPVFSGEEYDIKPDHFNIKYTCHYISDEIDFTARFRITGNPNNSLILTMEGTANKDFLKNRIGYCILHPIENYAGNRCVIEHLDGSSETSSFPEDISPQQVFRDIKSMHWQLFGMDCRIDFEGDIFETEDQRNWTDASFKTYSTPLSIPYPAMIEKGTRVYQKIQFRADGSFKISEVHSDKTVIKLYPDKFFPLPSVGICQSDNTCSLSNVEIKILRLLRFDHYRIDLHLFTENWKLKAEKGYAEFLELGYPIEFALFVDENASEQIRDFMNWFSARRPSVTNVLLLHKVLPSTPDKIALDAIPLLRDIHPDIKIATGTNANFAQLNRNRPGETGNDSICYSIQPQEHASDNMTLVENLKGQEYTVRSARLFARKKGVIVSPVTIQRRFNANNSLIELPWPGSGMPPQVDTRMMSLFGGCWTAGSLKYLCEAGADSITYYYTSGERGIIQGSLDSNWPSHFPSVKGMIFPVYYVFKYLLDNKNFPIIKSVSSNPLIVDCLSLTDGKEARIILVNFTGNIQSVKLHCCSGVFRIRSLDAENFWEAASNFCWTGKEGEKIIQSDDTIEIKPYSINFLDGWMKH